jgi:hypothetical protein
VLAGRTSLAQPASLTARARLVISGDTGPDFPFPMRVGLRSAGSVSVLRHTAGAGKVREHGAGKIPEHSYEHR